MTEEKKELGINEKLDLLIEKLDKKDTKEDFKVPYSGKVSKLKAKKGWVTYMVINENKNIRFKKFKIDEQTVMLDDIPRIAMPDDVLYYKGRPFIIQPEWSSNPYSPKKEVDEAIEKQRTSQGFKLLINRMKMEVITAKKKMAMGWFLGLLLLLVVGGYLAYRGGWFN